MFTVVDMIVNGEEVSVPVDVRESLLETLRDRLGLTSVKKGCEVSECGACAVLIDGEAIDACIYLTVWARGKNIVTVEGLSNGKSYIRFNKLLLMKRLYNVVFVHLV